MPIYSLVKIAFLDTFLFGVGGGAVSASTTAPARQYVARQSIPLSKEMVFDYWIAIPAQKAASLGWLEV